MGGKSLRKDFDKVACCPGYLTVAETPIYEDSDKFECTVMHSQQYWS